MFTERSLSVQRVFNERSKSVHSACKKMCGKGGVTHSKGGVGKPRCVDEKNALKLSPFSGSAATAKAVALLVRRAILLPLPFGDTC